MASAFVKFNNFVQDLGRKVHNLNADVLRIYLSNTAPNVATMAVKTDLAEITAANGYAAGGPTPTNSGYSQTGGVGKLVLQDVVVTASGGSVGPFRYAVLWNDTPTSPADPLIGYYDYGAAITLLDTETLTIDLDTTNGVFTVT